jgi:hypothetical protein
MVSQQLFIICLPFGIEHLDNVLEHICGVSESVSEPRREGRGGSDSNMIPPA